jgi:hypothetical protein
MVLYRYVKKNIPITQLIHISNQINQIHYEITLLQHTTLPCNAQQQQPTLDYYLPQKRYVQQKYPNP